MNKNIQRILQINLIWILPLFLVQDRFNTERTKFIIKCVKKNLFSKQLKLEIVQQ